MKRVLIVAYYYPPMGGGGILRTIKFIKYLPQFGYEPVVIAPEDGAWIAYDPLIAQEVKDINTIRIPVPCIEAIDGTPADSHNERLRRFFCRMVNKWHPDPLWRWERTIYAKLNDILEKEQIDVIYTTSPPHSVHGLGVRYKNNKGKLPWVADFRDSFFFDPNLDKGIKSQIKRIVFKPFEARYIKSANAVICATEPIARKMINLHGQAEKFQVITNGFDPEDILTDADEQLDSGKIIISYTGSFLRAQSPENFISAIGIILEQQPEWREILKLRFVGTFFPEDKEIFARLPEEVFEVKEYVTNKEALRYQKTASANCLIISLPKEKGGDEIFTGKIFEYIYAERPILALVPDGVAKEVIEKHNLGYVADSSSIEQIIEAIRTLIQDLQSEKIQQRNFGSAQQEFDRKLLTSKLAGVFNGLLSEE